MSVICEENNFALLSLSFVCFSYQHTHKQSLHGYQEGYDMQDLVLIQTFIGLSIAIGIVAGGSAINKTCQFINYRKIRISRQYVCQVSRYFYFVLFLLYYHLINLCIHEMRGKQTPKFYAIKLKFIVGLCYISCGLNVGTIRYI